MLRQIFTLFFLSAYLSNFAIADCSELIPKDEVFDFAAVTLGMNITQDDKARMLSNSCDQFVLNENNLLTPARKEYRRVYFRKVEKDNRILKRLGNLVATTPLGDSPIEKEYLLKLQEIRTIENPNERARSAYLLAQKYQGNWGNEAYARVGSGKAGASTPSDVLKYAQKSGVGGICRDFAVLLTWSLNQVSKAQNGAASQIQADVIMYPGHAVVGVKISENSKTKSYSLDPTNFKHFNPMPIPDLKSPDSIFEERYNKCLKIRHCLEPDHQTPLPLPPPPAPPPPKSPKHSRGLDQ